MLADGFCASESGTTVIRIFKALGFISKGFFYAQMRGIKNIFYILKDLRRAIPETENNPCKVLEFTVFL